MIKVSYASKHEPVFELKPAPMASTFFQCVRRDVFGKGEELVLRIDGQNLISSG